MIQSKLLKIAKRLNVFTIDDILLTSDEKKEAVIEEINNLLDSGKIKKSGNNQYVFADIKISIQPELKEKKTEIILKNFKPEKIEELFSKEKELEIYNNAPLIAKKIISKYMFVFKAAGGLRGTALQYFLKQWSEKYPEYKMAYSTFLRGRENYITSGIKSLIPNYCNKKFTTTVTNEMYQRFRDLYLSPKHLSAEKCIEIIKKEIEESETEHIYIKIPRTYSFICVLKKEFSKDEIKFFRTQPLKLPCLPIIKTEEPKPQSKITKKNIFDNFSEAANYYLTSNELKNLAPSIITSHKGYIKHHLMPFFKELKFSEITLEKIKEFKWCKYSEGLTISSINNFIQLLRVIIKLYAPDNSLVNINIKRAEYSLKANYLNEIEIKKLMDLCKNHKPEFYPILMTILTTGITQGELIALTWDCIDFKNKRIKINALFYKENFIKYHLLYQKREILMTETLYKILKNIKNINNSVFIDNTELPYTPDKLNEKLQNITKKASLKNISFITLRDTYASLLIKKNIPLTYIKKTLGVKSVKNVIDRYKSLIEKTEPVEIDLLEDIL